MKHIPAAAVLAILWGFPAQAQWTLDNDESRISFISTKANTAAEVHTFSVVDGSIEANGDATISIDLDTVDTAIEVRDERMRSMLFETDEHPSATLAARVDAKAIEALAPGESTNMTVEGQLMLHGTETSVTFDAAVARLGEGRIMVTSLRPVIINASDVGLLQGVEKLREVAGLPSISPAVPVTFVLTFDREA